jgi:D-aminopeptidase
MGRARVLGFPIGAGTPGPHDDITDVPGVLVGQCTIVEGSGPLVVGRGPVRTGVTVILPHPGNVWSEPLFAGSHRLNGNGEMTGLEWIRESGALASPIAITNTHSVGVVRDALVAEEVRVRGSDDDYWSLPVVAETWDGVLNDINGFHVRAEHLERALADAGPGPVAEGNVGGGTGMICHGFKGGIGSASRVVAEDAGVYTVGVLVQANYGRRGRLRVDGVPVGERIGPDVIPLPGRSGQDGDGPGGRDGAAAAGAGSIIVVVATDAPLLPHQCIRLAQRPALGIGRMGGSGDHTSGDLILAFSTANRGWRASDLAARVPRTIPLTALSDAYITPLFDAAIEATEEAILSALLAAETMTGRDGITAHRLDPELLREALAAG